MLQTILATATFSFRYALAFLKQKQKRRYQSLDQCWQQCCWWRRPYPHFPLAGWLAGWCKNAFTACCTSIPRSRKWSSCSPSSSTSLEMVTGLSSPSTLSSSSSLSLPQVLRPKSSFSKSSSTLSSASSTVKYRRVLLHAIAITQNGWNFRRGKPPLGKKDDFTDKLLTRKHQLQTDLTQRFLGRFSSNKDVKKPQDFSFPFAPTVASRGVSSRCYGLRRASLSIDVTKFDDQSLTSRISKLTRPALGPFSREAAHFLPIRRRFNAHDLPTDLLRVQDRFFFGEEGRSFRQETSMAWHGLFLCGRSSLI